MAYSDFYVALVVGVVLSLLYVEVVGVIPSGLIVPGYLGLVFDQPVFLCTVLLLGCCSYLIVTQVLARWVILYGRRKFTAMLLVGIALKLLLELIYLPLWPWVPFEILELRGIGVIVPGLIANAIQRQGVAPTLGSTLLLSGCTFVITYLYRIVWGA